MLKSFNDKTPRVASSAFISEAAYVVGNVEIGENSSVWPGAVIRGDFGHVKIGSNVCIQDNCVIHTADEITIGDNVSIAHGAILHCVSVESYSVIGIRAVLLHGVEVGKGCIIAAGALVTPGTKIPDNSLVMGSPAKIKGQAELEKMVPDYDLNAYHNLAEQYKKQGY
jgi:carbonic anhydrase/acetyltransferase-like protein (isoleucine patch superfamily)